jgi:hypothetical protein
VDIGAFESRGFTLSITGGNNQQGITGTTLASPLSVQVASAFGEPVQGGQVTFSAPTSGATATFPDGTVALDANGKASLSVLANSTTGGYTVTATTTGAAPVNFSLTNVAPLSLPAALPGGTYGSAYSQTLMASGGAGGPYSFALTAGALPTGLNMASDGTLSGTATAAGSFTYTVTATDSGGLTGSQSYTLTIDPATLTVTPDAGQSMVYGAAVPTLTYAASGFVNGDPASLLTGSLGTTAPATSPVGSYAFTLGTLAAGSNYTVALAANPTTFAVTPATLLVTASNAARTYGVANPPFTATITGFVNGQTLASSGVTGSPSLTTSATAASTPGSYVITAGPGSLTSSNYTFTFGNGTLNVTATPLSATGVNFVAVAGAPYSGPVATFTNADPYGNAASYTATITWGDGSTSAGTISGTGNTLTVTGTHTYVVPVNQTVSVQISNKLGDTTTATVSATATVNRPDPATPVNKSVFFARSAPSTATLAAVAGDLSHSAEYYGNLVTAAYQQYLGRLPDPTEVAAWVGALQNGLSDERLEAGFIGSPEYIQDHGGPGKGWITGMYQNLLGRTPSPAEVNAWLAALAGGASPTDVALGFAASPEREGQRITADYQTYLGRLPTADEVALWVQAFNAGHGISNEDIIAGFVGSPEFFQSHQGDTIDWLISAYEDILHRPPDPAGYQGWLNVLTSP